MATDALYQLYVDHYQRLEDGFANVRDLYGVSTLADAGIRLMPPAQFESHLRSIDAIRAGKWLARMLRGREHRWGDIEPDVSRLRADVEKLRCEAIGPLRAAG